MLSAESPSEPPLSPTALKPSPPPPLASSSSPQNPAPQIPLSWPSNGELTAEWIQDLMCAFDWSSKNLQASDFPSVFPVSVFDSLVLKASKILHAEPNCVSVNEECNGSSPVVVVGDVHGQLHDVIFLLQEAGFPSKSKFFVFNGDYVDRGAWGLETFLILLAWKVLFSSSLCFLSSKGSVFFLISLNSWELELFLMMVFFFFFFFFFFFLFSSSSSFAWEMVILIGESWLMLVGGALIISSLLI